MFRYQLTQCIRFRFDGINDRTVQEHNLLPARQWPVFSNFPLPSCRIINMRQSSSVCHPLKNSRHALPLTAFCFALILQKKPLLPSKLSEQRLHELEFIRLR
uniref:hypothetical protein n=1 Tax=Candidatus Electrothrix sp. TaxID=2170559 RepID=UPI0040579222